MVGRTKTWINKGLEAWRARRRAIDAASPVFLSELALVEDVIKEQQRIFLRWAE
jgi:hypothetical protein